MEVSKTQPIRDMLLRLLNAGERHTRGVLLSEVAKALGESPRNRKLRAKVSGALRRLEEEGLLVDGGPEVWLRSSANLEENSGGED